MTRILYIYVCHIIHIKDDYLQNLAEAPTTTAASGAEAMSTPAADTFDYTATDYTTGLVTWFRFLKIFTILKFV